MKQRHKPRHIAVIMDGNRRWAASRGLPFVEGYREGSSRFFDLVEWCNEEDIPTLTVWMLSLGNLRRRPEELNDLFVVISEAIARLGDQDTRRVCHLGFPWTVPDFLRESLAQAAAKTSHIAGKIVNVAVAYDGRAEIVHAVRSLVDQGGAVRDWEEDLSQCLHTKGQDDPDLVIRTSGEYRLSGFMTWQSAQSELYFTRVLWPDFNREQFDKALFTYARRQRRFGR